MPQERFVKTVLTCDICQKQLEISGEVSDNHPWFILTGKVICSRNCAKKWLAIEGEARANLTLEELYGIEQADQKS